MSLVYVVTNFIGNITDMLNTLNKKSLISCDKAELCLQKFTTKRTMSSLKINKRGGLIIG